MLYASTKMLQLAPRVRLQPYLNGGINFDADDVGGSDARYGVGLDCRVAERFTAAAAVLGRHQFGRLAPRGSFDVPRLGGAESPLFGLRGRRADLYDFSVGGRVDLWRDIVMGFANVIIPLNDDGVRAAVIPTVGIEATF